MGNFGKYFILTPPQEVIYEESSEAEAGSICDEKMLGYDDSSSESDEMESSVNRGSFMSPGHEVAE